MFNVCEADARERLERYTRSAVLGWAAITNTVDPHALLLFLIIFAWTPPHFWALAIARRDDYAKVDIPPGMVEVFGDAQWGGHLDVVVPVWRPRILDYENATLAVGLRLERVDYNVGTFTSTGDPIGDDVTAVVPSVSFRPTAGTVFRANYRYHWIRDFARNPTSHMAGFQLGFATYF